MYAPSSKVERRHLGFFSTCCVMLAERSRPTSVPIFPIIKCLLCAMWPLAIVNSWPNNNVMGRVDANPWQC